MSKIFVYIGTQDPRRMGITLAEFDTSTGRLTEPALAAEARDPGFLALRADGKHLYICNSGTPGGVSAFSVDRHTGRLTLRNHIESSGRGPSYLSLDNSGRFILDANYGGGFVEVLSLNDDGSLGARTSLVRHSGSSVHPQRQGRPYAHWFHTDPGNRFAIAADLGTDSIIVYLFDAKDGSVSPHDSSVVKMKPGSGPRHLAWHPDGVWVYAVQELSNEVCAFRWDASRGQLTQFQTLSTLAAGFDQANTAAEIAVRADGRFVYVSNRGEDSLVVYAVDAATGSLSPVQRTSSGGQSPRYFAIDPTNHWLLAGNQESGDIVMFRIDELSGMLSRVGSPVKVVRPTGIVFATPGA